jgi:hypothetical protein
MKTMAIDSVILGDNQFFGVNHMSEEKALAQTLKFQDIKAVIDVLDIAYDNGIRTFMCTTHDRIGQVCDHMRANKSRYKDFIYYPGMPYAHKYANAVTEDGVVGALKRFVPGTMFGALFRGGKAVATKDTIGLMKMLVDAEMKMFKGLRTDVIFIQNVVTDMILGLGFNDILYEFAQYIKKEYDAEPGFITMNLPKLLAALESSGVENPIVCASINKIGFRMCGGIDTYERVLREKKFRAIAMSVFASGAIPPAEALEYVSTLQGVQSIVFGASSKGNIVRTKELIEKYSQAR